MFGCGTFRAAVAKGSPPSHEALGWAARECSGGQHGRSRGPRSGSRYIALSRHDRGERRPSVQPHRERAASERSGPGAPCMAAVERSAVRDRSCGRSCEHGRRHRQRPLSHRGSGSRGPCELSRIARDQVLLRDLRAGRLRAAQAEADRRDPPRREDQDPARLAGAPRRQSLVVCRRRAGVGAGPAQRCASGPAQVTIQDVLGFIKLVHTFTGAQVVVRGQRGQALSSLPAVPEGNASSGRVRDGLREQVRRAFLRRDELLRRAADGLGR